MDIKIQAKQTLRRTKSKRPTMKHIIVKLTKKNLESSNRKVTHHVRMMPNNIINGFSAELFQARRHWDDIFKVLKEKKKTL